MKMRYDETFDDDQAGKSQQRGCPELPPPISKVLRGYFALKLVGKPPRGKAGPVTVNLVKTGSAIVGSRIWIVIETAALKGGTVNVEILGGADAAIVAADAALTVMEGGAPKSTLSAKVGAWSEDTNISNAAAFADKAVIELELKPETEDQIKTWRAAIGRASGKKALFHLKVTATGGTVTEYAIEDDALTGPDKERSILLNRKDERFELHTCFCDKEFTVADLRMIYGDKKLFSVRCPLPADQKTYTAFATELNAAMKAHSINTCLRKAHFLAQVQAETDWLNTTVEYASGADYDKFTFQEDYNNYELYLKHQKDPNSKFNIFRTKEIKRGWKRYSECEKHGHNERGDGAKYKGHGLIQLTWKDTYAAYFRSIGRSDLLDTPGVVASDVQLACDSAAWFWSSRKPSKDLNLLSDLDDLMAITLVVNGQIFAERTHYTDRKSNVLSFIEFMKIKDACHGQTVTAKAIGIYTLARSKVAKWDFGIRYKAAIQTLDD